MGYAPQRARPNATGQDENVWHMPLLFSIAGELRWRVEGVHALRTHLVLGVEAPFTQYSHNIAKKLLEQF